jgi:hypothetical protein
MKCRTIIEGAKESIWLFTLLGTWTFATMNQFICSVTTNDITSQKIVFHACTKHIEEPYHIVEKQVQLQSLDMTYIPFNVQIGDRRKK